MNIEQENNVASGQLVRVAPARSPSLTEEQAKEAARMATLAALTYKPNIGTYARRLGYAIETLQGQHQSVFFFSTPHEIIIAFRGSKIDDAKQQRQNFSFRPIQWMHEHAIDAGPKNATAKHPFGLVHEGFYQRARENTLVSSDDPALLGTPLIDAVHQRITALGTAYPQADIRFLGYSSGGAIAPLQAAHLAQKGGVHAAQRVTSIMTFGAPRFGHPNFFDVFSQYYGDRYTRIVLDGDPVPHLPPRLYLHKLPRFGYVDGTDTVVLPQPAPSKPRVHGEAKRKSFLERHIHGLKEQISERHGIHNYLRACTDRLEVKKERFLRDLYTFASEKAEAQIDATFLPPFVDSVAATSRHLADMLQYTGSGLMGGEAIPALSRKSSEIQRQSHNSFFNQLAELANISRESAELLAPMQDDPDIAHLRQYCDYVSLEAAHMQASINAQIGHLAHTATSLRASAGLSSSDVDIVRKAGNAIKEWLQKGTSHYESLKSPLGVLADTFAASPPLTAYAEFAQDMLSCMQARTMRRG